MPNSMGNKVFEEQAYSKVVQRIIPVILVALLLAYLDRVNVSFAKEQMQLDLGFSDAAYGLGAGIFFIGYFLFEIPSNMIMHKVGARMWIARIMVTWGLASAAMMFVKSEMAFYILRFLVGAAEAGFAPGVLLYFTYWFPAARRARINAFFIMGIALSGVIGGPVAGVIMSSFNGAFGISGWQWLFLTEGVAAALFGIVVYIVLDDGIDSAKWLKPEEKSILHANLAREQATIKQHSSLWSVLKDKSSLYLAGLYFLTMSGFYGFVFWLPQLIKDTGVESDLHVGLLTAIPYIAACIAMPLVSKHSDRTGERRKHLTVCLLLCAVGYICSAYFKAYTVVALIAITLSCASIFSALPVFWTLPPKFLTGISAATGIAFINSVGNLSGYTSNHIIGKVTHLTSNLSWGLYTMAGFCILGVIAVYFLMPANLKRLEPHYAKKAPSSDKEAVTA